MISVVLLLALCCLVGRSTSQAEQCVVYVDPVRGNDMNVGTQSEPVQSLIRAHDVLSTKKGVNLTIFLAEGIYSGNSNCALSFFFRDQSFTLRAIDRKFLQFLCLHLPLIYFYSFETCYYHLQQ